MVVAPGGGFRALMMSYEGADIARRLNTMGIDAFVLKYRLTHNGPGSPAREDVVRMAGEDGRQAVRLVRDKAGEFGYRPERVGMIGFSAGGMVTSDSLFGPAETRPNFAAIIYGAREVKEIPDPAPPLFLAVAADDAGSVGRTVDLFTAYRNPPMMDAAPQAWPIPSELLSIRSALFVAWFRSARIRSILG
jgi:acetyl esterase/lipase